MPQGSRTDGTRCDDDVLGSASSARWLSDALDPSFRFRRSACSPTAEKTNHMGRRPTNHGSAVRHGRATLKQCLCVFLPPPHFVLVCCVASGGRRRLITQVIGRHGSEAALRTIDQDGPPSVRWYTGIAGGHLPVRVGAHVDVEPSSKRAMKSRCTRAAWVRVEFQGSPGPRSTDAADRGLRNGDRGIFQSKCSRSMATVTKRSLTSRRSTRSYYYQRAWPRHLGAARLRSRCPAGTWSFTANRAFDLSGAMNA